MQRTYRTLSFAAVLVLAACNPAPADEPQDFGASSSTSSVEASSSSAAAREASSVTVSSEAAAVSSAPEVSARIVTVLVTNFAFNPTTIDVQQGEKVTLVFQGVEGVHGVAIEGLGINVAVPPGETVAVTLPTDTTGTFSFRCSVPCGPGHRDMRGTIVIR